jgi:hypothetical protein
MHKIAFSTLKTALDFNNKLYENSLLLLFYQIHILDSYTLKENQIFTQKNQKRLLLN